MANPAHLPADYLNTAPFIVSLHSLQTFTQLCKLLLEVWGSKASSRPEKCGTAVVVVEGKAYRLESSGGNVYRHDSPVSLYHYIFSALYGSF